MLTLDLSGIWRYRTDEEDKGITQRFFQEPISGGDFILPGSTCENRIGTEKHYEEEYSRQIMRCPVEKYEYIAPIWLEREFELPKDYEGKSVQLYLERVNISSMLWIDGEAVGREVIELSAPHVYRLPAGLKNGRHRITLRIDNRDLVNMADMASGYSVDTQGIWNGVIGKIELQARNQVYPECIQVYPKKEGIRLRLTTVTDIYAPMQEREAYVKFTVKTPDKTELPVLKKAFALWTSTQNDVFEYDISDIRWWDEFSPDLYEIKAELFVKKEQERKEGGGLKRNTVSGETFTEDEACYEKTGECSRRFGMRILERRGRKIFLNGRQIFLRGTIDCAQFPLTGYPPTDLETWRKRMAILKKYGFNHVRFHAWCPPKAAFEAADEAGMYVGVEMPMWLNRDICKYELGSDPAHADYYRRELFRMLDEYGNHPSLLLFSNGNENMGDFALMEQLTTAGKAYDPRHLYTTTSNFDHPVQACEDYFNAFQVRGHRVRLQTMQGAVAKDNWLDYQEAVEQIDLPVISFEVGQYCVYPDVDIIEDYTGNILPVNFEMVRKLLMRKGVYDRRNDYVKASGSLAFLLYKEDVEAALRTKDMGGIQLLSFSDYTGQSLATIGLLDVFLRDKDVENLSQWTEFCNHTVPLFRHKRNLSNTDVLEGELSLYDYGKDRIDDPCFVVEIYKQTKGEEVLFTKFQTTQRQIRVPLNEITEAAMLSVRVSVQKGEKVYRNRWQVFVYPGTAAGQQESAAGRVEILTDAEELRRALRDEKNDKKVIVDLHMATRKIKGAFIPVFWSPVHFPSDKPCGAIIEEKHPVFADFPTGKYLDYQWKELLDHAVAADISKFGTRIRPMMELVPNFTDNTANGLLFEAKVGKTSILFCGFDLSANGIEALQLRKSVLAYVESDAFHPDTELKAEDLSALGIDLQG